MIRKATHHPLIYPFFRFYTLVKLKRTFSNIVIRYGAAATLKDEIALFAIRIFISLSGRQNVLKTVALVLPLQLSMGLFLLKSITASFYKGYQWKGRNI